LSKKTHNDICNVSLFSSLYTEHSRNLKNYLYYKYGSTISAIDRVQDAFIKLWENCKKIPPKSAKSYLFKTANNMMLNDMRHKKVVLTFQKIKPKEYTNENPEFLMQKNQFLESYQTALGNLKEEQRVAFLLYKVERKSYGEIGELMNVTSRVIEYRVVTALKKLKNEIEGFTIK